MYSIIDIESNGGAFKKESIIEIAIYRFDGHEIVDQFISLVNPEDVISPYVQKLTGITAKMVKTAPKFHEIAKRIVEITEGTVIVGHNVEFDYRMIRQSFHRLGYNYERETIDTIPLAKKLIPNEESYSLGKLSKSLGIPLTDRHRASGDARATLELFKILLAKDQEKEILKHQKETQVSNNLNKKIMALTEFLPAENGIIYFQNANGEILYTDYSSNIYQTATKIFHARTKKWDKLKAETTQIHYEFTGNELIAKLMMLQKTKKKTPSLPFGLYYKNEKYIIERTKGQTGDLLKFKSFSQGNKVKTFINEQERFQDNPTALKEFLSLDNRNEIWISEGRTKSEKSFLVLEKGKLTGYGFYELHHQIKSLNKINKLKIEIHAVNNMIYNELKLSLLRNNYEIKNLPTT
ncbi:3'-5' exonuclease [Elizabethkingia anophelis]|uniref:3'-5' exonuclease n=2 Tax=Elizabethkingia anophelis TaxID=1117645 RepID=X5KG96_9FLAO|nr:MULTISPECIES: 3'-5' exonuclease [Elizabethkingia]AIL43886.1 DNA polymerase III epsilon subunit [Elizabethkingia anophelis NUHP1]AKH96408.1 DNA polymerase III subunit epsilon [Elizabethkingia anophelis FMS-007]AMR42360.1 DNA polymerase III subunit epsilon [Elizabethkingia anophelis]AMX49000.1 DNA polymerase III subunit epsilon [Elizabethkingia anophelis]AMX52459.1 DNA polymerase III subunit epsilon [Elizabethkingia anophelis]